MKKKNRMKKKRPPRRKIDTIPVIFVGKNIDFTFKDPNGGITTCEAFIRVVTHPLDKKSKGSMEVVATGMGRYAIERGGLKCLDLINGEHPLTHLDKVLADKKEKDGTCHWYWKVGSTPNGYRLEVWYAPGDKWTASDIRFEENDKDIGDLVTKVLNRLAKVV